MKRLSRMLILAVLMNALAPLPAALAQQSGSPVGEPLREQIARLESIERDPATSPEVRELNRNFLLARRAQLRDELKKRVGALVGYLTTSGSLLSEAEAKTVRASIESLTAELQSLGGTAAPEKETNAARIIPASFAPADTVSHPTTPQNTEGTAAPQDASGGAAQGGAGGPAAASTPECEKTLSDGDTVTYSVANLDSSLIPPKISKGRISGKDKEETAKNVKAIIEGTVYTKDGTKTAPLDGDYCIVHIIEWLIAGDKQAAVGKADVLREHWSLYKYQQGKEVWVPEAAQKGTRIYGKSRVNVLAIHLNAGSTWDIDYTVSVTKKTPTNIANVLDLASIITGGTVRKIAVNATPPARWGGGLMCINAIPSDIAVQGEVIVRNDEHQAVQQPKTYSKTYDNEGKYWWDVSIGVPFKEVKEVQFNSDGGTVTAKEVTRQNAYGFLNIFFPSRDLKDDKLLNFPHLVLGVPISKKPLDNPVVGIGYGIRKFSLKFDMYAGVVFNRVREPRTLGAGDAATQGELEADFQTKRVRKFVFGVNLPLRQVKEALSGK
jgi:hypothetical protein